MAPLVTATPYSATPPNWGSSSEQQIIFASDPGLNHHFGGGSANDNSNMTMSRNGKYLFVGTRDFTTGTFTNEGKLYVFEKTASPEGWTEIENIFIPDFPGSPAYANSTAFGQSVSVSDDGVHVLIGAEHADAVPGTGNADGAVYYYEKTGPTTWTFRDRFFPSSSISVMTGASFGHSVSMSSDGTTCVIGAFAYDRTAPEYAGNTNQAGTAFIFNRSGTTWSQVQQIDFTGAVLPNDRYGSQCVMSPDGSHCMVTAKLHDSGGSNNGTVSAWVKESGSPEVWSNAQQLQPTELGSPEVDLNRFGSSFAISSDGNTAIIGCSSALVDTAFAEGAAFVYTRSTTGSPLVWSEVQRLIPSDPTTTNQFGYSSAITPDGSTVVIGAWADAGGASLNGAAYVWTGTPGNYTEQTKLTPSTAEASQLFGIQVEVSPDGSEVFVGAQGRSNTFTDEGAVYVYEAG